MIIMHMYYLFTIYTIVLSHTSCFLLLRSRRRWALTGLAHSTPAAHTLTRSDPSLSHHFNLTFTLSPPSPLSAGLRLVLTTSPEDDRADGLNNQLSVATG